MSVIHVLEMFCIAGKTAGTTPAVVRDLSHIKADMSFVCGTNDAHELLYVLKNGDKRGIKV